MSIEFSCDETAHNVGAIGLAIKAHLYHHATETQEQRDCIEECKVDLKKYEGVTVW